jgi:hypothetical protein
VLPLAGGGGAAVDDVAGATVVCGGAGALVLPAGALELPADAGGAAGLEAEADGQGPSEETPSSETQTPTVAQRVWATLRASVMAVSI